MASGVAVYLLDDWLSYDSLPARICNYMIKQIVVDGFLRESQREPLSLVTV